MKLSQKTLLPRGEDCRRKIMPVSRCIRQLSIRLKSRRLSKIKSVPIIIHSTLRSATRNVCGGKSIHSEAVRPSESDRVEVPKTGVDPVEVTIVPGVDGDISEA